MEKVTDWIKYTVRWPLYFNVYRPIKYWVQRQVRGFSDDETWGLNTTLGKLMLPRFRRYRELNKGIHCVFWSKTKSGRLTKKQEQKALAAQKKAHDDVEFFLLMLSEGCDTESSVFNKKRYKAGKEFFINNLETFWW